MRQSSSGSSTRSGPWTRVGLVLVSSVGANLIQPNTVVDKMRRIPTRGAAISAVIAGAAIFLVVFSLRTIDKPTHQFRVVMGSMGEHLINVWLDPDPPGVGQLVVTAQATDVGGNPRSSSMMIFLASPKSGGALIQQEGIPIEVKDQTDVGRFMASLDLSEPGEWVLNVKVVMGGEGVSVSIPVLVATAP